AKRDLYRGLVSDRGGRELLRSGTVQSGVAPVTDHLRQKQREGLCDRDAVAGSAAAGTGRRVRGRNRYIVNAVGEAVLRRHCPGLGGIIGAAVGGGRNRG